MSQAIEPTPAAQAPVREPHAFEMTNEAFAALVHVESASDLFARELMQTQKMFSEIPPPAGFWYVAPPEERHDAELKTLIEARRAEHAGQFRIYWHRLDQYHRQERWWRNSIQAAKVAADEAVWELDPADTPPLKRTVTAIKRTLQRLGGTVPPPMIIGDGPPYGDEWKGLFREQRIALAEWVDELRLLIFPLSKPAKFSDADSEKESDPRSREPQQLDLVQRDTSPKQDLDADDLAILQAFIEFIAKDPGRWCSFDKIAPLALGPGNEAVVKERCMRLARLGYLESKRGNKGGYRIVEAGRVAHRAQVSPPASQLSGIVEHI